MRIPALWLSDYLTLDKPLRGIAADFTTIGLMLDKPIENQVLDLEQRLNRSDLLSILGCARDLSVFENVPLKEPKVKLHQARPKTSSTAIKINVQTPAVRRFNTRVFRGLTVKPSPSWLKERLLAYGVESINNVVDITNFVMLELGQPIHAQDTDKFMEPEITLRPAKKGEQLQTLLGTTIKLDPHVFVLSSGDRVTVIGGIVGGKQTGVTASSTNIILDAGNYDPRVIRTTSRQLKILNETVSRYDKPLDPRLCEIALNRATDLILTLAGGTYYQNIDYYPHPVIPQTLSLSFARLRLVSGIELPPKKTKTTLQTLGYTIIDETPDKIIVEVPYFRTDLEVEDDLISDVLRMLDYNHLPLLPLTSAVPPEITSPLTNFEDYLRDVLVSLGGQEHITSPLLSASGAPNQVKLANALTIDQNSLRTSILDTLSQVPVAYQKHALSLPPIFELGKVFTKKGRGDKFSDYQETNELGVITPSSRDFLASLFTRLGISNYHLLPSSANQVKITIGSTTLGLLSSNSFSLNLSLLHQHFHQYVGVVTEYAHRTSLDLSLRLPANLHYCDLEKVLKKTSPSLQSIEVLEELQGNLLVRLYWKKLSSKEATKNKITLALKKLSITSRSG